MIIVRNGDQIVFRSDNPKLRLRAHAGVLFVFRRGSKGPGRTFLSDEWTSAEHKPDRSERAHIRRAELFRRLMAVSRAVGAEINGDH